MPAVVLKRGDKYRVVEKWTNQLVKRGGKPVDGGGHTSQSSAQKQASAINIPSSQRKRKK